MLLHFNYRFVMFIGTIIAAIGKIHEMIGSFDMIENPVGTAIKILGIIVIVVFLWTDNSSLQSEG